MPANNRLLPLDQPSVAEQLRKAGYRTGYIGKWHLDGDARPGFVAPERRRGFEYWAAFNRGHRYFDSTYFRDSPEPIAAEGFEPDYQTSLAVDFIARHKAHPFYLYVSWGPPHTPRTPPPEFARLYDPRQFRLAPNVPSSYAEQARKGMAGYYGLCSALDRNVGRLLKALDEHNLASDTVVVFTADHGDMLGAQGLEYKGVPYEESARVPLLVRYPRKGKAGTSSDLLVSNVDLAPTLLSLCGAQVPASVQGMNLAGPMFGGEGEGRESLFVYGRLGTPGEWRMAVRGSDKFVADRKGEATHQYNLIEDPHEINNLAQEPGQSRRRAELAAYLRDWMKRLEFGMDPSGLRVR